MSNEFENRIQNMSTEEGKVGDIKEEGSSRDFDFEHASADRYMDNPSRNIIKQLGNNTVSNLGTGEGLFVQKVGIDLEFKSLTAGTNVTLTASSTDITIAATSPIVETFTSSGTWTKATGAVRVFVEAWGGGGAGAGSNDNTRTVATGGGGGVYAFGWFKASDLSATESVTVGSGAISISAASNADGSAGNQSNFGSFLTAAGGKGGTSSATNVAGGDGGKYTNVTVGAPLFGEGVGSGTYNGEDGLYTGAGGGGSVGVGGGAYFGGAGGGGDGGSAAGGTSELSGDGGAGGESQNAIAGSFPSGGGGGCNSTGAHSSGSGGNGQIIATTYF